MDSHSLAYITDSGLAEKIGRHLSWLTKPLFGLDGCFASAIILSLVGGYPVGAKTVNSLYKKGAASESECKRAGLFLVCSGPGFLVNFIGAQLYGIVVNSMRNKTSDRKNTYQKPH